MKKDRFKGYDDDVRELVLGFEEMQQQGESHYFDVDQMEIIIDFYLESTDIEMIEKSVSYGEYLFPNSSEMRLRRAHLLCFKEQFKDALAILNELELIEPDNPDVQYAMGVVFSATGQPRKAIQHYQKSITDDCDMNIVYSNIGDEYVKMDRRSEARVYYRKAIQANPNDEHALYELSLCFEEDGLTDKWIHFYSNFLKEQPYSKVGWYCLGDAYYSEQLYEKAIDAYKFSITVDPTYYYSYTQISACYYALRDFANAISYLREAVNYCEDKASIYFKIADIYKHSANLATSNIYLEKAVKEDPFYGDAWNALALNLSIMHEYSEAVDASKKALSINPESPLYLTTLALIHSDYGHPEEAEQIFEMALPYYTEFDYGWIAYADFLLFHDRYHEAIDALNNCVDNSELQLEISKRMALCYLRTGKRNLLFNAVRACLYENPYGEISLLDYIPDLRNDHEVMEIIESISKETLETKKKND